MGWGDELMVTADVRRLQLRDPRKVAVRGKDGLARFHAIWAGNPRIARPEEVRDPAAVQWCDNYSGHRPYLDYSRFINRHKATPYVFTDYRVEPGEIYLSPQEWALGNLARGAVILEPNVKPGASPNKDWGFARWVRLAHELRDLRLVQIGPIGTRCLQGVQFVATQDVRQAAGVLSGAELLIAPEGGLHHAAAALGVPAVVIFGGFISPETTGYDAHTNLFTGGKACGMRIACKHCEAAMAAITPADVAAAARARLEEARSCSLEQEG